MYQVMTIGARTSCVVTALTPRAFKTLNKASQTRERLSIRAAEAFFRLSVLISFPMPSCFAVCLRLVIYLTCAGRSLLFV